MLDKILLRIAKTAILSKFNAEELINQNKIIKEYPFLSKKGASFVTLHYDHQLRGCIGSIIARRPLLEDIIQNSFSSAFKDPRFRPLESSEFSHLTLEISVLSEPKLIDYDNFYDLVNKVHPNIDGLILKHKSFQGTFLPQVWEQLKTPKEFLEHLSFKAGTDPSIYTKHPQIYAYQVEAIEDSFQNIETI